MSGFTPVPHTQCSWSRAAWVSDHSSLTGCGRIRYKQSAQCPAQRKPVAVSTETEAWVHVSFLVTFAASAHLPFGKIDISPPIAAKVGKVKVTQLCPTLCDLKDCIVHGILQARILEWAAFPFSRGSSQPRDRTQISHIARRFFTS